MDFEIQFVGASREQCPHNRVCLSSPGKHKIPHNRFQQQNNHNSCKEKIILMNDACVRSNDQKPSIYLQLQALSLLTITPFAPIAFTSI